MMQYKKSVRPFIAGAKKKYRKTIKLGKSFNKGRKRFGQVASDVTRNFI